MKNILITGGAGFVGINLTRYLIENTAYKITVLDNLSTGNLDLLKRVIESGGKEIEYRFTPNPGAVCFFKMDILKKEEIDEALKGQWAVVHLAAQTGVLPSLENPMKDAEVNIIGTLNLLEASVKHKIETFIFASSAAPLGEQEPPLDEGKIPRPLSPYGASKLAGEGYCSAFYGSFGLNTLVLRFSNLYGPDSFHKGSVVAQFIKQIIKGESPVIYGDGSQTRDFLYTGELCRCIAAILESENKGAGEVFQLGSGIQTSVNQLVELLKEVSGVPFSVIYKSERKGEIRYNYTSIEKARKWLGFQPTTDLKTGLSLTWQWFKK